VQLPSWWDQRRKLGLALSAHTPVDGVVAKATKFGRDQLVEFRWELALGDETLTEAEIAALAAAKAPLVRLRGQWVTVDTEQVRRGLEFLRRAPTGRKTVAEILALAASHPDDTDTPLAVTSVQADGWLGDLLGGAAAQSLEPVEPPAGLAATLRPYQQRGLAWLAFLASLGLGGCLADDMGLGKTVQLLALEMLERERQSRAGPTLLLCPMSLVGNWQREAVRALCFTQFTEFAEMLLPHLAARFGQDVAYLHGGTPKKRRDELVTRFQSGDGPPIFLLSLKAGGTGLNLTAANHVLHLDRWWNPAVENQATDRAFRIGQKRNVQVHKFICTGTLEEKIDEMIEEKKALADLVVTDGEGWLTELSTRELRNVLALSEDAVGD
jgi:SNF2 family DNA or RNA helicase